VKTPNLSRLVTIQRRDVTQDATYGTEVVTWVPLAYLPGSPAVAEKFRAELMDEMPSRSERVQSGMQIAANRSRMRIRWRDDVDSTMQVIVHGESDETWQIIGGPAEVGGKKKFIELVIERYSTAGNAP
jgi:head-tail adaptor